MENIYVQFDGMVYQQIVGIPMGTNCAPLIADLFLYCYERDFMSDLQKSKRFDLIDMFNDTSRYLDDIFTIDNPEGPRSSLCTQVPCLAVKKWNRSIITESNIFYKCIIPIIRKEYAWLLLTTTLGKNGKKRSFFCA